MQICCMTNSPTGFNIKKNTVEEWFNSDYIKEIRQQFLKNEKPSICEQCWTNENAGAASYRQKGNTFYKVIPKYANQILKLYNLDESTLPVDVELQLSNQCNLSCMMCHESESSRLLAENKVLKISNYSQKNFNIKEESLEQIKLWLLSKPKFLVIRGGEPTIIPEIKKLLYWMIENDHAKSLTLQLHTNGTGFNDEWYSIINQFLNVKIIFSVDAIDNLFEYIRFGAKWNLVNENIKRSVENKIEVIIHTVVQNLNLLGLDMLFDWIEENQLTLDLSLLLTPSIFSINNLPTRIKQIAYQKLTNYQTNNGYLKKEIQTILNALDPNQEPIEWDKFREHILLKDNHRKLNIFKVVPELQAFF